MTMAAKRRHRVRQEHQDELHERVAVIERALVSVEARLAVRERPRVARVVFDPSKPEPGGATQR
jgi:hypothetical protein